MTLHNSELAVHGHRWVPRLGFLGVGWIGRHRMEALLKSGVAEAVAIVEPSEEIRDAALALAPHVSALASLDDLLTRDDVDGVVIATPSAMHADQSIRALDCGKAVFCQKPLGRNAEEVRRVIAAARRNDRLLAVDLSYRFTSAMSAIRAALAAGEIGEVFAADLVFHNAYGPDKPWFYDPRQSGGGCVMDLGIHLVDLALWLLDFEDPAVDADLFSQGKPLADPRELAEDYATVRLKLANGAVINLACSWRLHAGQDAVISAAFHGTRGGLQFRNIDGSFYDFAAELHRGTSRTQLAAPPDDWGGRAAIGWARQLAADGGFDADVERMVDVTRVLDRIYATTRSEGTLRGVPEAAP